MGNCCSFKKKARYSKQTHNALETPNAQNESRQADVKQEVLCENEKEKRKSSLCDADNNVNEEIAIQNPDESRKSSVAKEEKERKLVFSFDLDSYYRKDEAKVLIEEIIKEYRAFVGVNQLNLTDLLENQLVWKSFFELRELYSKIYFCFSFSKDLSKGMYKDKNNLSSKLADSNDLEEYYLLAKDIVLKNNKIFIEQIENSQKEEMYDSDILMVTKLKSYSLNDDIVDTLRKEYEGIEKLLREKSTKLHGLNNENSLISQIKLSRKIEIADKVNSKPNLQLKVTTSGTSESSKKVLQKAATPKSIKKASILESENEEDEEKKTFGDIF